MRIYANGDGERVSSERRGERGGVLKLDVDGKRMMMCECGRGENKRIYGFYGIVGKW